MCLGGVLRNYFRCIPNGTIKTIVRTDHTVGTGGNCHYFDYKESYYGVNENKKRVDGHWSSPETMDKIYINHYKIKSLEDYNNKLSRWGKSAKGDIYKANLTPTLFNEMDAMMNNDCPLPPFIANITS